MKVEVLLFASLRERVGQAKLVCEIPDGATAALLIEGLRRDHPGLRETTGFRVAVNSEYTNVDRPLQDGDEIALIPPVSGG